MASTTADEFFADVATRPGYTEDGGLVTPEEINAVFPNMSAFVAACNSRGLDCIAADEGNYYVRPRDT